MHDDSLIVRRWGAGEAYLIGDLKISQCLSINEIFCANLEKTHSLEERLLSL
jgi:hypothetical protein